MPDIPQRNWRRVFRCFPHLATQKSQQKYERMCVEEKKVVALYGTNGCIKKKEDAQNAQLLYMKETEDTHTHRPAPIQLKAYRKAQTLAVKARKTRYRNC